MSKTVNVVFGLNSESDDAANIKQYENIAELENDCKTLKSLYIVYNDNEIHKLYFDIDYKKEQHIKKGLTWNFEYVKNVIFDNIKNAFKMNNYSIAESHKENKISFRVIINDRKMKISDMPDYIKETYKDDFEYDCIDYNVYYTNGKIRLPYCIKDEETNRPLNIIKGEFKDFITNLTDGCELKTIIKKPVENDNEEINDEKIKELLNILGDDRGDEYNEWFIIGSSLKSMNKEYINMFNDFSMNRDKYKGIKDVTRKWKKFPISINSGIGALINMAKVDNPDKFNEWCKKWNPKPINKFQNDDDNFWETLDNMNHSDYAKMFHKIVPNKYVVSKTKDWYEYNKYNILINQNGIPSSLSNYITNTLQDLVIKKRNEVIPNDTHYNAKTQLVKKAYQILGNSTYIKGIIDYLEHLYLNLDLDDLIDADINLLAFNDKVYDMKIKGFRNIEPSDYITKTTKTNAPIDINENKRTKINKLLLEIFGNDDLVNYWLKTTALSLFTNKFESLYILTGTGGNGKGLLSTILNNILGDYIYTASNTFLTEKIKGGQANSTLAKCKGIRYLLVSEPDDGSNEAEFNVEFIKMITGGDMITTRDLYKSNFSFKPQFTPFVQCNSKPKLGKMDNGIKRRIKIHNYPFEFVEKPDENNKKQKPADTSLKSSMDKEFYNNFMLLLLEIASNNIDNNKIEQPEEIINGTSEYFDLNNPVKHYIESSLETEDNKKIKITDLYDDYLKSASDKISKSRFKDDLLHNGLIIEKHRGYQYVMNVKIKVISNFDE